jgi:hypothetical protein
MKDSVYNAIIFYLIIVIGIIFIKHPIFFNNGYDLKINKALVLPNFIIFVIILAFISLYLGRHYS